jgi:hypothetical protein
MLIPAIFLPYCIIIYMYRLAFILVFSDLYCIISNLKYRFMKVSQSCDVMRPRVTDLFDKETGAVLSSFNFSTVERNFHIKQVTCVVIGEIMRYRISFICVGSL